MTKFPFFSNVNSTTLTQGRLKIPPLKCTFTPKLVVVLPQIFKKAGVAGGVIFQTRWEDRWRYGSPARVHPLQRPPPDRTARCLYPTSDRPSPCRQPASEAYPLSFSLPSLLGGSPRQSPRWLDAHAAPDPLRVNNGGFHTKGRKEAGRVEKGAFCFWGPWNSWMGGDGREREGGGLGEDGKTYVPLLSLQVSVPDDVLLLLNCKDAAMGIDPPYFQEASFPHENPLSPYPRR